MCAHSIGYIEFQYGSRDPIYFPTKVWIDHVTWAPSDWLCPWIWNIIKWCTSTELFLRYAFDHLTLGAIKATDYVITKVPTKKERGFYYKNLFVVIEMTLIAAMYSLPLFGCEKSIHRSVNTLLLIIKERLQANTIQQLMNGILCFLRTVRSL